MGKNEYLEVDESSFGKLGAIHRIIKQLADHEEAFKAGKRDSLFMALCLCAQYQAVIPVWAADAMLQGATDLRSGECKDFNALFGWNLSKQQARKREAIINENSGTVLAMLAKYRCDGGSMNAEEAFGFVSEHTSLPRRIVEAIYQRHQQAVKSIPQGNPGGHNYGTSFCTVPMLRRYGRKIL